MPLKPSAKIRILVLTLIPVVVVTTLSLIFKGAQPEPVARLVSAAAKFFGSIGALVGFVCGYFAGVCSVKGRRQDGDALSASTGTGDAAKSLRKIG